MQMSTLEGIQPNLRLCAPLSVSPKRLRDAVRSDRVSVSLLPSTPSSHISAAMDKLTQSFKKMPGRLERLKESVACKLAERHSSFALHSWPNPSSTVAVNPDHRGPHVMILIMLLPLLMRDLQVTTRLTSRRRTASERSCVLPTASDPSRTWCPATRSSGELLPLSALCLRGRWRSRGGVVRRLR